MGPIDYTIQVQNPINSALAGYQQGLGLQEAQTKQQMQQQAFLQQQQAVERQNQISQAMQRLRSNPAPTARDYADLSMMLPKDQSESMRKSWDMLDTERKQAQLSQSAQVFGALQVGRADIAEQLLRQQAEAAKNAGDEKTAQAANTWAELVKIAPKDASAAIGVMLAQLPEGKGIIEGATKLAENRRSEELQPAQVRKAGAEATTAEVGAQFAAPKAMADLEAAKWNVKNLQNQINVRGAQLGLDRQRLAVDTQTKLAEIGMKMTEVPPAAQKLINDAAVTAGAAKQQAGQYNDLAKRITSIGSSWGAFGSAAEWLKKSTGEQGAVTALRQEYTRLRNSAAVGSLPPGPATDRDIAMVLEGFPSPTADPTQLAAFLRGMGKLKDIDAAVEGAKVDWLAGNRGALTRAASGFVAGDYAVKPGETFADFQMRVAKDVGKRYSGQSSAVDMIPTPQNPNPGGNSSQIMQAADAILRGGK